MMRRREVLALAGGLAAGGALRAHAQVGMRDLRVLSEGAANSFDSFSPGVNRNAIQITWNVYDRLVRFARRPGGDGITIDDQREIVPELAESYEISADGRALTFHLRPEAIFHDGTPITADDVKWSLDRVVASPIGRAQFATGSMTGPEQFVVLDPHTLRIDLPVPDRRALPNLALTYPIIVNRRLALAHATAVDPWAGEWLQRNPAGGGAYRVARAEAGQRILFERFDGWKSGALPFFERVLWQTVPAAEGRVAALLKGDADIVQDLPAHDVERLLAEPRVRVAGAPSTTFQFIAMNTAAAPFDDVRVRQAVAWALPYEAMFQAALQGRGERLFGAAPDAGIGFPRPLGYSTDLARAREALAQSRHPDGFETTFSYELSVAGVAEPLALLVQEALAGIGIRVRLEKIPAGQMGTLLQERRLPFYFEGSTAFLADPDYFFRIFYSGDTRWNFGAYANPEFEALVEATRFEADRAAYERAVRRMIALASEEVPVILLWRPWLEAGLRQSVQGYGVAFHRQLDFRPLSRA